MGLLLGLLTGAVLGFSHFGGLWLTLRRLPGARRPALLGVASGFVRLAVTGAGLALLASRGSPLSLVAALAGIVLVRRAFAGRVAPEGPWS